MGGSIGQGNRADSNDVPEGLDEEVFGVDGHHREAVEAVSAGSSADADAGAQGTELRRARRSPGNTDRESLSVAETREREGGTWKTRCTQERDRSSRQKGGEQEAADSATAAARGMGTWGELHCVS